MQAVFSGRVGDWYYVDAQGKPQGPFAGEELVAWYSQGVLRDESLVLQLPEGEHVTAPPSSASFEALGRLLAAAGGGAGDGEHAEDEEHVGAPGLHRAPLEEPVNGEAPHDEQTTM